MSNFNVSRDLTLDNLFISKRLKVPAFPGLSTTPVAIDGLVGVDTNNGNFYVSSDGGWSSGVSGLTQVEHDASLTGAGTLVSPLELNVQHDLSLTGAGSAASPLVLNVQNDGSLTGLGSAASPLGINIAVYENGVLSGNIQEFDFEGFENVTTVGNRVTIEALIQSISNTVIVQMEPEVGQFSSIREAVESIPTIGPNAPADNNRWLVLVNAGEYNETATIDVPEWVYITGEDMGACKVVGGNFHLFNLANNTGIAFLTTTTVDSGFNTIRCVDAGDFTLFHKLDIYDSPTSIFVQSVTQDCLTYFEYVSVNDATVYALRCASTGAFENEISIENFFTAGASANAILVEGISKVNAQSVAFQDSLAGTAIQVNDSGKFEGRGVLIENWTTGVLVPVGGVAPELLLEGVLFVNNTMNMNILNPTTTGHFTGYTEYTKTFINTSSEFFITNEDQQIVTVATKGGDFDSVRAAVNFITDASPTRPYSIYVGPGTYVEDPIVMKEYIVIMGFFRSAVLAGSAATSGVDFITGAPNTAVRNLTITGQTAAGSNLIRYDGGNGVFGLGELNLVNADVHIRLTNSQNSSVFMQDLLVSSNAQFRKSLYVTDNGVNFTAMFIDGYIYSAQSLPGVFEDFIHMVSSTPDFPRMNFSGNLIVANAAGVPAGNGIRLEGFIAGSIQNSLLGGFSNGLYLPNVLATAPNITFTSSSLFLNTMDINVENPAATGTINAVADRTKVFIDPNANMGVIINGTDGSLSLGGELYQGATYSEITNVTKQLQQSATLGAYGNITITNTVGTTIQVGAGNGYVMDGTNLDFVEWTSQSEVLPATGLTWLYIAGDGSLNQSPARPDPITNIIIAAVSTSGGSVLYIQDITQQADNLTTQLDETFREGIGAFFGSGAISSTGSGGGLTVQVSSGSYWYSNQNYTPSATDNINMLGYYGGTNIVPLTEIPLEYDNAGVLTPIPAGQWVKHALYVVGDGANQRYLFVYGQELFGSQAAAETGPLPLAPTTFTANVVPITGIVVTDTDVGPLTDDRFRDVRPQLGSAANTSSATADHNSLLNLAVGNAHPQYFRVDGTSVMTGNIDVGGNSIVNVNLVDGVDVPAHASRHLPNGADPLTTAAPVTINTVNSAGVANSFSRSDHVHAHGAQTDPTLHAIATSLANGFMSSTDKAKLDAATPDNSPSTLVQRSPGGNIDVTTLSLESAGTVTVLAPSAPGNVTVVIPSVTDTLVNLNSAQVLTNKTITSATNTVSAKNLLHQTGAGSVDIYTGVSAPVAGQALIANDPTSASWQDITASVITGILPVANGGTGVNTITSNGVMLGNGVGPITSAKQAPVGDFVGTTDLQVLTNKTLTTPNISQISNTGTLTLPTSTDTLVARNTTDILTNKTMTSNTNNVTATGVFSGAGSNTVNVSAAANPTSGQALIATSANTATWQDISASSISGILPVANGGTGASSLTSGNVVVGNGTSPVTTTKAAPAGDFVGTTDTQVLTNKTITSATNTVSAKNLLHQTGAGSVDIYTGVAAPVAGQALIANNSTSASWQDITASSISGILPVANGGTGVNTITSNGVMVGNGVGPVTSAKQAPVGDFVGTTDTQVLTNKTLTSATDDVVARGLWSGGNTNTINVSAAANPTSGQVLTATSTTTATWQTPSAASLTGILPVANGGTGNSSLTSGNVLVGNGTSAVLTTKAAPAGDFVGTTDSQVLTNKTITSTTNTVRATQLGTTTTDVVVSTAAAPTAGQVLTATSGTAATWQTPSTSTGSDSVIFSEVQPSGTGGNGGAAFTSGAWRTRFLNTTNSSPSFSSFASITANQITFTAAGTYLFEISAPGYNVNLHKIKLRNITTATDILIGTSEIANNAAVQTRSIVNAFATIPSGQTYEVQHQCSTNRTPGFGQPDSFGVNEVYTICKITKQA